MGSPMSARDLMFLDLETSGLVPGHHDIVEAAAVRLTPKLERVIGRMHRLVKMRHPARATQEALTVNGYDEALWSRHGVDLRVALVELEELARAGDEPPIVVGNNPWFDLRFIERASETEGYPVWEARYGLDIGSMAWPLVMRGKLEKIGLDTLCSTYNVVVEGKGHSAMVDVKRAIAVYAAMLGLPWKGLVP